MRVLHETSVWSSKGPTASGKASLAQGRLSHIQDILIVAFRNAVGYRGPGLRGLMGNPQLIRSGDQLSGIIGVNIWDLAVTAKPLEGFLGGRAEFVLHGDRGNEARIQIFNVDRIPKPSDAVFLAPLGGDKVICCHNFTRFRGSRW